MCEGSAGAEIHRYSTDDREVLYVKTWFHQSDSSSTVAIAMALLDLSISVEVQGFLKKKTEPFLTVPEWVTERETVV